MSHLIVAISFIASILTIGDVTLKIMTGADYNLFAALIMIVVIVSVQFSLAVLMEIKVDAKDKYIPIMFYIFIPIVITASSWGYYNRSILPEADTNDAILEAFKISLIIGTTVLLFLFWSRMFRLDFHRKPKYIGVSYGIPVMLTLSVIVYRYIFNNVTIDAYFGGFLFLVLITMLFAAGTKSQSINELFKPRLKIYDEATEWSDDQAKKKDNRIKQVVVNDDKILLSLFISTASFVLFWSGSIFGGLFLPFIVLIIYKYEIFIEILEKFKNNYVKGGDTDK